MRFNLTMVMSLTLLATSGGGLTAQEYLTKNGKLAQTLKVIQLQGGFAGFTGVQYTISPDGAWKSEGIFNKKITPKHKGMLTEQELVKLGTILKANALAKLPKKSGIQPGANPHILTFEFGKRKSTLVGQVPPKLDRENPTDSVESRFAGIWAGVVALVNPPRKQD